MRTLYRFGFKQALRGAIIVGLVAGFMLTLQGVAYQKTYSTKAEQEKFAASLTAAPSLGLIYGNPADLKLGTSGYMVYRVVGFMGVVTAVWGLATATRLLRGAEEDGRWEVIRTSTATPRTATLHIMLGFVGAWALAGVISTLITLATTSGSGIDLSLGSTLLINTVIFLPGLLFAALGVFTSQLALTRGRAYAYGLVPLVLLFLLRGLANTHPATLHGLLSYTPFGWALLVNPVLATNAWWLLPFGVFAAIFLSWGVWLAERDLGSSVLYESTTIRSRYYLLGGSWKLALRQNTWSFIAWAAGALMLIGITASLTSVAINATSDSTSLSHSVHSLAGNNSDLKVAFLGAGMVFLVMVLLIMAITIIGAIRRDEAKQYLDSILVSPQTRTRWLTSRLALGYAALLITSLLSGVLLYVIATSQNIHLDIFKILTTSICLLGSISFVLGLGVYFYGIRPRLTVALLYVVVGWSFLVTLLASAVKLNTVILHSSLFEYTSFNLAHWPNWGTFVSLTALGLAFSALGVSAFNRRDIITE